MSRSWLRLCVVAAAILAVGCTIETYRGGQSGQASGFPGNAFPRRASPLPATLVLREFDSSAYGDVDVAYNADVTVDCTAFGPFLRERALEGFTRAGLFRTVSPYAGGVTGERLELSGRLMRISLSNAMSSTVAEATLEVTIRHLPRGEKVTSLTIAEQARSSWREPVMFSDALDPLANELAVALVRAVGESAALESYVTAHPELAAALPNVAATPPEPVEPPESTKAPGPVRQRWALVIGISKYRDKRVPALRYAGADARAFHAWLVSPEGGGYDPARVRLLCDEKATGAAIRDALFTWLKKPIAEDLVTIYYAGHGSPESPDSPKNLFLLPYDVDYGRIGSTGFPMWDIETSLKRFIRARRVIVIADACHAAGVGREFDIARRGGRAIAGNTIVKGLSGLSDVGPSVCVLSAADASQLSQEDEKWGGGHGVFTYFLLEGLKGKADGNGDGRVTVGELIPYLSEQVRRATASAQCPKTAGDFDPALAIAR